MTELLHTSRPLRYRGLVTTASGTVHKKFLRIVSVESGIGMRGFWVPPDEHIVDVMALADPLLARLPAINDPPWRSGHFRRAIPNGYLQSLRSDKNALTDQALAAYYDKLRLVTRGKLFSAERWRAIWELNTSSPFFEPGGARYRLPSPLRIESQSVGKLTPDGSQWNGPGTTVMGANGVFVQYRSLMHASQLELALDNNDVYVVELVRDGQIVGRYTCSSAWEPGLRVHRRDVGAQVVRSGYNAVRVYPTAGDGLYSLGHLHAIADKG